MSGISTAATQTTNPLVGGASTLYGVSWEQFKTIDATLDRDNGVKLSYWCGVLEIVSPTGVERGRIKSTLGLLLEAYMREGGIRFYRCGGFTIESPETASGNPNESYAIGSSKDLPDIVIEVIVTSGKLDKKELYRLKQVPEVWFWKQGEVTVFGLEKREYVQRDRSQFFPDFDLDILKRYLEYSDQYETVTDFINNLRSEK
ncbi:MAG: Uma2 family endonuclease [Cyanophyceae cyanobacterium]